MDGTLKTRLSFSMLGLSKLGEALGSSVESFVGLTESEAQIARPLARIRVEAGARDAGDADVGDQMAAEGDVVAHAEAGYVGHDVVSAARLEAEETCVFEGGQQFIAANEEIGGELLVITWGKSKGNGSSLLQGRSGADGEEVMDLANG